MRREEKQDKAGAFLEAAINRSCHAIAQRFGPIYCKRKVFYSCKLGFEAFISEDSLLNHEKSVHTKNVPLLGEFTCKLCSEVFITKDILLNHEQFVHTNDLTESNCDEIQKEVDLNSYKEETLFMPVLQ